MSLVSRFKDWYYEPIPVVVAAAKVATAPVAKPEPKPLKAAVTGFSLKDEGWVYQSPVKLRPALVSGSLETETTHFNVLQEQDFKKLGVCVEVICQSSSREYWRQPSERAIRAMIQSMGLRKPLDGDFSIAISLVSDPDQVGLWLRVRFETPPPIVIPEAAREVSAV